MSLEGVIEERALARVLFEIAGERRTGILTVQGEQEIVGVSFLDGQVVSADALNQTLEEGLGEVLASRGLVAPEDYAALAAEHQAGGGRVVDLLVERNFLSRDQLLESLRGHTYRLCRQLLAWRSGEFKFYHGEEVSYEEGVSPLGVEELLVRASRDLGERGPLEGAVPLSETVFDRVDGSRRAAGGDSALGALDNEAESLLTRIDGVRTVTEVARGSALPEYRALLALYQLERQGRIRAVTPVAPAPAAAAGRQPAAAAAAVSASPARRRWWSGIRLPPAVAVAQWSGRLLGLALLAAVATGLAVRPGDMLLPFGWQRPLVEAVDEERRGAVWLAVDRAARSFFLLEGRFPETLGELAEARLVRSSQLVDPADGRRLGYTALAAGYLVYPQAGDGPEPLATRTGTITGDFLLDPEFVVPQLAERPPLVLLD